MARPGSPHTHAHTHAPRRALLQDGSTRASDVICSRRGDRGKPRGTPFQAPRRVRCAVASRMASFQKVAAARDAPGSINLGERGKEIQSPVHGKERGSGRGGRFCPPTSSLVHLRSSLPLGSFGSLSSSGGTAVPSVWASSLRHPSSLRDALEWPPRSDQGPAQGVPHPTEILTSCPSALAEACGPSYSPEFLA